MSSAKWRLFCLGLNVLRVSNYHIFLKQPYITSSYNPTPDSYDSNGQSWLVWIVRLIQLGHADREGKTGIRQWNGCQFERIC